MGEECSSRTTGIILDKNVMDILLKVKDESKHDINYLENVVQNRRTSACVCTCMHMQVCVHAYM